MAGDTPQGSTRESWNPWNQLISEVTKLWPTAPRELIQYFHPRRNQSTPWVANREDNDSTIEEFRKSLTPALRKLEDSITSAPSEEVRRLRVLSAGLLIAAHQTKDLSQHKVLQQKGLQYLEATEPLLTSSRQAAEAKRAAVELRLRVVEAELAALKPRTGLEPSGTSPGGRFSLPSFLKHRTRGKGDSPRQR